MQCPECGRPMYGGLSCGLYHWACLWCATDEYVPHYTLDGHMIMEPVDYFLGEAGLRWARRWVDPRIHEILTEQEWLAWMRRMGYRRVRQ